MQHRAQLVLRVSRVRMARFVPPSTTLPGFVVKTAPVRYRWQRAPCLQFHLAAAKAWMRKRLHWRRQRRSHKRKAPLQRQHPQLYQRRRRRQSHKQKAPLQHQRPPPLLFQWTPSGPIMPRRCVACSIRAATATSHCARRPRRWTPSCLHTAKNSAAAKSRAYQVNDNVTRQH